MVAPEGVLVPRRHRPVGDGPDLAYDVGTGGQNLPVRGNGAVEVLPISMSVAP